jgi:hypothetical protein
MNRKKTATKASAVNGPIAPSANDARDALTSTRLFVSHLCPDLLGSCGCARRNLGRLPASEGRSLCRSQGPWSCTEEAGCGSEA